uniref:Uncharacterized protein n=1 Tax=Cacopsylla melanoneura TaxID=428564 RepID=A0A8D8TNC0_9HEMI
MTVHKVHNKDRHFKIKVRTNSSGHVLQIYSHHCFRITVGIFCSSDLSTIVIEACRNKRLSAKFYKSVPLFDFFYNVLLRYTLYNLYILKQFYNFHKLIYSGIILSVPSTVITLLTLFSPTLLTLNP